MKKIVFALALILVVMTGRTQSFEGIMQWSIKMDITDPATKAKMEEAKKKANDPANQAKMKEMQSKMNDPQFKAMLESNPQMKQQMEAMMKMMTGGDLSSMIPSGVLIKIKGLSSLTAIQGGIMDKNEVLYLADKDQTYTINHPAKTYMVNSKATNASQEKPKVTKTSETTTILGHKCTKYIIETKESTGKSITTNYWSTTEIKEIDMKALAKQQMSKDQTFVYPDVEGVPLKMEVKMPQGVMVMEVTELRKQSIPSSELALPAGYKETKI